MTSPNTIIADMQAEIDALLKERDEFLSLLVEFSAALPSDEYMAAQGQAPGPLLQRIRASIAKY